MKTDQQTLAQQLANQPYTTITLLDQTTGGEPIYISYHPEIEGCIAQGPTPDDAETNLASASIDFIFSLLQDGLPVPPPEPSIINTIIEFNRSNEPKPEFTFSAYHAYLAPAD